MRGVGGRGMMSVGEGEERRGEMGRVGVREGKVREEGRRGDGDRRRWRGVGRQDGEKGDGMFGERRR